MFTEVQGHKSPFSMYPSISSYLPNNRHSTQTSYTVIEQIAHHHCRICLIQVVKRNHTWQRQLQLP